MVVVERGDLGHQIAHATHRGLCKSDRRTGDTLANWLVVHGDACEPWPLALLEQVDADLIDVARPLQSHNVASLHGRGGLRGDCR